MLLLGLGLVGSDLSSHDAGAVALTDRLAAPVGFGGGWAHPLGTDQLGRDVLARVLTGARASLIVAISATALAGTIGSLIGLTGGYFGGRLDLVTTWLGDVQMAIPFVVVAIAVAASVKPSVLTVVIVLGVTGWASYARVARLAALPLRRALFVDAARVMGAGSARVMFRHVLPVILPTLLAIAGQQTGAMMLYESALSFLGLGVPAGTITWGGMIADSREISQQAWWATVAPGLAIVVAVLGFNAFGTVLAQGLTGTHRRVSR
jgi:peptide/nickel transport system permease protein